jgi:hypothetical protein
MSRTKTQAELDQEDRDAALARQLQLEADQADAQRVAQQAPPVPGRGPVAPPPDAARRAPADGGMFGNVQLPRAPRVRCTNCRAYNLIDPAKAHLQQICGRCRKLLPPLGRAPPTAAPPVPVPGGGGGSSGAGGDDGGVLQGTVAEQQVQARCGQCSAINALPLGRRVPGSTISFKCGCCGAINRVTF